MNRIEALEWLRVNMESWGEGPTPDGWEWLPVECWRPFLIKRGSMETISRYQTEWYIKSVATPPLQDFNCKIIRGTPPLQGALAMLGQIDRFEPCGQSFGESMNDLKGSK